MALDSDLSPAAETVLNAVTLNRYDVPYYACLKSIDQIKSDVAAALRGAAGVITFPGPESLLAIADELEGSRD
jgi:hypothetical protein